MSVCICVEHKALIKKPKVLFLRGTNASKHQPLFHTCFGFCLKPSASFIFILEVYITLWYSATTAVFGVYVTRYIFVAKQTYMTLILLMKGENPSNLQAMN